MALKDFKMVDEIYNNAKKLRAITPYSFKLFFDKMEIFNPFSNRHKENFDKYKPESILCLPILPSEIFYITFSNLLKCPDRRCENFIDKKELEEYNENCYNGESDVNGRIRREGHFSERILRTSNYDSVSENENEIQNDINKNYYIDTFGKNNDNYANDYNCNQTESNEFNNDNRMPLCTEGIFF